MGLAIDSVESCHEASKFRSSMGRNHCYISTRIKSAATILIATQKRKKMNYLDKVVWQLETFEVAAGLRRIPSSMHEDYVHMRTNETPKFQFEKDPIYLTFIYGFLRRPRKFDLHWLNGPWLNCPEQLFLQWPSMCGTKKNQHYFYVIQSRSCEHSITLPRLLVFFSHFFCWRWRTTRWSSHFTEQKFSNSSRVRGGKNDLSAVGLLKDFVDGRATEYISRRR